MSPSVTTSDAPRSRFPRVSGDEPYTGDLFLVSKEFSPRERG